MAALWDLDWKGPPPSDSTETFKAPVRRPRSPTRKVSPGTLVRLSMRPPHKRLQAERHLPAVEIGNIYLGKAGGSGLAAVRDLVVSPPDDKDSKKATATKTSPKPNISPKTTKKGRKSHTQEEGSLLRVFKWLDLNGDNYVDVKELYEGQRSLGGNLSKQLIRDIMWEVDDDVSLSIGAAPHAPRRGSRRPATT